MVLVAILVSACGLGALSSRPTRATADPTPVPYTLSAPPDPSTIDVPDASFFGWALLDRRGGTIAGSANSATATSSVESMIKPWIAADHLRRLDESGERPSRQVLAELNLMIVDSNDPLAEKYYQLGGADAVVRRLKSICGLPRLEINSGLWSYTEITAQDTARYGLCLADGRAAGPWTQWILEAMRRIRGGVDDQVSGEVQGGDWGVVDGLPPALADGLAVKNGWTLKHDGWHIASLAIHPEWVLAITMRKPGSLSSAADACASVARRLVVVRPG